MDRIWPKSDTIRLRLRCACPMVLPNGPAAASVGSLFRTTRFAVQDAFRLHRETPLSDHLEIETYTWEVLPEHLKTGDIVDYVSREIDFVRAN